MTDRFIGGGNRRKPPTCCKLLTSFIHNVVSSTPCHEQDSNSVFCVWRVNCSSAYELCYFFLYLGGGFSSVCGIYESIQKMNNFVFMEKGLNGIQIHEILYNLEYNYNLYFSSIFAICFL